MDGSLFGKLPGELRNTIWRNLLVSPKPIDVTNRTHATEPAILATCQQIRKEATSIYYGENAFSARQWMRAPVFLHWCQSIGRERAGMITQLNLDYDHVGTEVEGWAPGGADGNEREVTALEMWQDACEEIWGNGLWLGAVVVRDLLRFGRLRPRAWAEFEGMLQASVADAIEEATAREHEQGEVEAERRLAGKPSMAE